MIVTLYIDNRETKLFNSINERDLDIYKDRINIEVKQLELGDAHIIFNDRCLIFERKTVSDLLASVKDGRYKEQKCRLLANSPSSDITYIIEGDDILSSKNRNQNILTSLYTHCIYRDDIHIIFVKDVDETTTFLLVLISKIIDNVKKFNRSSDIANVSDGAAPEYIDYVKAKSSKIKNITPENCYLLQLSQIPNISIVIAKNIQKVYPTLKDIIFAMDKISSHKDRINKLCEIKNIGKEKAFKILEFLMLSES